MNQNVEQYVLQSRSQGISDEIIRKKLLENGWADTLILEALNFPRPAVHTEVRKTEGSNLSMTSPYSQILATLLTVFLFILTNGLFSDIKANLYSPNKLLMFEALAIVPFLMVGILVHFSMEDKNRFRILSLPYFIISAWLTLRLLEKVVTYILDKNAALGIYLVLGVIVVILTGVIIFTQKSNHKENK